MNSRLPGPSPHPPHRRRNLTANSHATSRPFLPLPPAFLLLLFLLLSFARLTTAYTELPDAFLASLPSPSDTDFDISPAGSGGGGGGGGGGLLAPILIPRVPGTEGQAAAQAHFARFFGGALPAWGASWHNSTATTPATGDRRLPFANLLLRREPPGARGAPGRAAYLTLAAHYDSKIKPEGFVGATDSAAPCAMLLHVARSVEEHLVRLWGEGEEGEGGRRRHDDGGGGVDVGEDEGEDDGLGVADDVGIQILLLDGEEAFVQWTETDSLYGARALAEEWDNTVNPALSTYRNPLGQISMFVLLDLLGSAEPSVPSYFQTTHWAYRAMARVEERMRGLGLLESTPKRPFLPQAGKKPGEFRRAGVEDDHIPFMRRGVPILHIIPSPFPAVWHKMEDDGAHLDLPTVRDWARIVTAFALEWLDVKAPPGPSEEKDSGDGGVAT